MVGRVVSLQIVALVVAILAGVAATASMRVVPGEDDAAGLAILKLWSSDQQTRALGKREILALGQNSVGPLMVLLDDLFTNAHPRFAVGTEVAGEEAIEHYRDAVKRGNESEYMEALRKICELAINRRLESDAIRLLGELRAEAAARLLLKILESDDDELVGLAISTTEEMQALRDIGPPAVPDLVRELERVAEGGVGSLADSFTKNALDIQVPGYSNGGAEPRNSEKSPGRPFQAYANDREKVARVRRVLIRMTIILGGIGDRRALPALERLESTSKDQLLIDYIRRAFADIRRKG